VSAFIEAEERYASSHHGQPPDRYPGVLHSFLFISKNFRPFLPHLEEIEALSRRSTKEASDKCV
jgi:hypothetical protein